jgi:GIY-YIG domain-containing protein
MAVAPYTTLDLGGESMSRWTQWRKIANRNEWFGESLDWDGPACYELGIGGPRGGHLRIVYVGETVNEHRRVIAYASHGSHLSETIAWHLARGWHLFYRAQLTRTKKAAIRMQNSLLARFEYDWNIQRNGG